MSWNIRRKVKGGENECFVVCVVTLHFCVAHVTHSLTLFFPTKHKAARVSLCTAHFQPLITPQPQPYLFLTLTSASLSNTILRFSSSLSQHALHLDPTPFIFNSLTFLHFHHLQFLIISFITTPKLTNMSITFHLSTPLTPAFIYILKHHSTSITSPN